MNEGLIQSILRNDKPWLNPESNSCKCKTLNWTATERTFETTTNINGTDENTNVVTEEYTDAPSLHHITLADVTPDVITNESMGTTKEPKFGDDNLAISGTEPNEIENENPFIAENSNNTDYDYSPDDNSALQQLVSFVYLNNNKTNLTNKSSQLQHEVEKKVKNNVRQQSKKALNTKTTMVTKKLIKKSVSKAVTDSTPKVVISNTERQRPEGTSVITGKSDTKNELSSPPIKPADKSKLRMQHMRSKDKQNLVTADELSIDASEFETKLEDLESILFNVIGLQKKNVQWKDIPFRY